MCVAIASTKAVHQASSRGVRQKQRKKRVERLQGSLEAHLPRVTFPVSCAATAIMRRIRL